MAIDRAFLEATRANLQRQEREFLDAAQQARGALLLVEELFKELPESVPEGEKASEEKE